MNSGISTRIVAPRDCILGFGIPTSESEFRADLNRQDKDFAKRFDLWARYQVEVASVVATVEPVIRGLGVRVVHGLTLTQFRDLVATVPVFILFSHWVEEQVEFANGLQDVALVADAIPHDYAGILDLCVCRSDALAIAVRSTRPKCLVRHVVGREVTPDYWLYFFLVLFKCLDDRPTSYLTAVECVVRQFVSRPENHQ